ncbi:ssk1 response regulator receiver, partial [Tulasnella sp. 408]
MPKTSPDSEAPIDGITATLPLPSSSTFQLTWPAGEEPPVHSIPSAPQGAIELAQHSNSSPPNIINPFFDPVPMSAVDYVAEAQASSKVTTPVDEAGPIADGVNDDPNHPNQPPKRPTHLPRFSRASSTPLPAQLKHLHHPSRRNVIRQIIAVALPRDEIEIGLYVSSPTGARLNREYSSSGGVGVPPSPTPSTDPEEPLVCTLEITHRFASPNPVASDAAQPPPPASSSLQERRQPDLNTAILQNTLRHVRATLQTDVTPSSGAQIPNSRTYELSVLLSPGPAGTPPGYPLSEEDIKARQPFNDFKVASEPTLDELASFVAADGGLKGKKAVFHASERSSFAHHLTSYLTAWGMDVSHVPIEAGSCPALAGEGDSSTATSSVAGDAVDGIGETESASSKSSRSRAGSDVEVRLGTPKIGTPKSETPRIGTPKSESPESSTSSGKARQLDSLSMELSASEGVLQQPELVELAGTNFVVIDDDVNEVLDGASYGRAEAVHRPVLRADRDDPDEPDRAVQSLAVGFTARRHSFYVYSAWDGTGTSDRRSPKGHPAEQQVLQQQQNAAAVSAGAIPAMTIPMVPMTYTGQPHMYTPHPPSPLSRDAVEYFSVNAAATQIGDSTGVLVHSPDGRPAGIFFQPQQQSRDGRRTNSSSASEHQGGHGGRPQVRPQPPSFMGLDAALANVSPVVTPGGVFPPPSRFRNSPGETSALPSPTTPARGIVAVRRSTSGGEDPGRPPLARNLSSRAAVPLAQINGVPRRKTSNTGSDGGTGGAKGTPDRPRPLQIDSAGAAAASPQSSRPSLVESPRGSSGGPSPGLPKKVGRRSTGERPSLASVKKVKSGGDGSIVPPINVLIVE